MLLSRCAEPAARPACTALSWALAAPAGSKGCWKRNSRVAGAPLESRGEQQAPPWHGMPAGFRGFSAGQ